MKELNKLGVIRNNTLSQRDFTISCGCISLLKISECSRIGTFSEKDQYIDTTGSNAISNEMP